MTVTCSREVMAQTHFKYGPFKQQNEEREKKIVRMRNVKNDAEKQHVKNIFDDDEIGFVFSSVEEYTWGRFFITTDLYMSV